jgi:2-oxoglutarate ferredoxin oxidoreductase subunit gamma
LRRLKEVPNRVEIRMSGLGGQGVVLAGQILGRAAVHHGKNAAQTQSYGAEARGTTAKSEVIISDGKIGFPAIRKCDALIVMNQEAADKNAKDLKADGILLIDSSNVKKIPKTNAKIFKIPATQIAEVSFGQKIYANMIMLGALTQIMNIVSEESMEKAIRDTVPEESVAVNIQAYKRGRSS